MLWPATWRTENFTHSPTHYCNICCFTVMWQMSWKRDAVLLHRRFRARPSTFLISSDSQYWRLKVLRYRSSNCWMISTVRSMTSYHVTTSTRSIIMWYFIYVILHCDISMSKVFFSITLSYNCKRVKWAVCCAGVVVTFWLSFYLKPQSVRSNFCHVCVWWIYRWVGIGVWDPGTKKVHNEERNRLEPTRNLYDYT